MRVKTISVTYGRKFNLDEYESLHVEQTMWADLDEGDDPAACEAELWSVAKAAIKAQAMPVLQVRNAKREQGREATSMVGK